MKNYKFCILLITTFFVTIFRLMTFSFKNTGHTKKIYDIAVGMFLWYDLFLFTYMMYSLIMK